MESDLKTLVDFAQHGDRDALEAVVRRIQDRVHHLAMRMLVNPDDALAATQEIMILVVTKLSTFRRESAFQTWVYRISVNYLLGAKRVRDRERGLSFEVFRQDLENGLVGDGPMSAEDSVMLNELRISCTMAMLLCLDLKSRVAYVLGDILELGHTEASEVLGVSKDNFRKRLSRARAEVVAFTARSCGLANPTARCRCPRRLPAAIAMGRLRPGKTVYAGKDAPSYDRVVARVKQVEGELKTLKLQTATPLFGCPEDLGERIARIVEA